MRLPLSLARSLSMEVHHSWQGGSPNGMDKRKALSTLPDHDIFDGHHVYGVGGRGALKGGGRAKRSNGGRTA